jgi:hypothetical protein
MPASGDRIAPGDLIDGRYEIEAPLGAGGMAVVYRARHTGTGARSALKLVHTHLVPRGELVEMFLREARVGGRIGKHPNIVEVLDAGFDPARGVPYLVMELLEGETLEAYRVRCGPMPPALLASVFAELGDALDHAHRAGVVHRDLKPSNLFLTMGARGAPSLRVMDFGIAKVLEGDTQRTATQIGTPAYAAPEQMGAAMRAAAARQGITVAAGVSPATDVWAMGLIAYELLTGQPATSFWGAETTVEIPVKAVLFPHERASARAGECAPLLPPGFDAWFARATSVDASARWPSAGAAAAELGRLLEAMPGAPADVPAPVTPAPAQASLASARTELGLPLLSQPSPVAAPIAWAPAPTPPPGAPYGPSWAPPVTGSGSATAPQSRAWIFLLAGSLAAMAVAIGAGVAFVVAPRFGNARARESCLASGDRCEEACEGGDAASCARFASRLERGDGVLRDEARAAALHEKACDGGDPDGCAGLGRLARHGKGGLAKDPARAIALFQKACDGGGARGCALLGEGYRDGTGGLARDDVRAVALFQSACDRGETTGCKDLGGMHQYGRGGLPKDDEKAATFYQKACDAGDLLGCNDLGVRAGAGRGVGRDEKLAADLYKRACDGGELIGCGNLAWMYEHGKGGLPKDSARARELYEHACQQGDARGCGNLAVMVEHGRGGGTPDPKRAATLYQKACDDGDVHACDNLGIMIEYGKGGLAKDEARAVALYQKACDAGDLSGCKDLGYMHEYGKGGLAKDEARAAALYQKACDAEVMAACANLGVLLSSGRGIARDESRAVALYQRACDADNATGCANLGWAYFLGRGTRRDRARALELLRKACTGGSAWGCERLEEAGGGLQPRRK